jgi:hypothetical protein
MWRICQKINLFCCHFAERPLNFRKFLVENCPGKGISKKFYDSMQPFGLLRGIAYGSVFRPPGAGWETVAISPGV